MRAKGPGDVGGLRQPVMPGIVLDAISVAGEGAGRTKSDGDQHDDAARRGQLRRQDGARPCKLAFQQFPLEFRRRPREDHGLQTCNDSSLEGLVDLEYAGSCLDLTIEK